MFDESDGSLHFITKITPQTRPCCLVVILRSFELKSCRRQETGFHFAYRSSNRRKTSSAEIASTLPSLITLVTTSRLCIPLTLDLGFRFEAMPGIREQLNQLPALVFAKLHWLLVELFDPRCQGQILPSVSSLG